MLRYGSSVTIDRSPEVVFPYITDPEKQKLWSDVPMRPLSGSNDEWSIGTKVELTVGMGPIKAVIGMEIVGLDPGRRMAFKSFSGPIKWEGEYTLEDLPSGGTKVSQAGTLAFTGLWRLVQPMVGAEMSRGEVKELEKLKGVVEGG